MHACDVFVYVNIILYSTMYVVSFPRSGADVVDCLSGESLISCVSPLDDELQDEGVKNYH